jgi:signal transduction histidine kinase
LALSSSRSESLRPALFSATGQTGFPRLAAIAGILLGGFVLAAWIARVPVPAWAMMKANAALALILCGVSLWLCTKESQPFQMIARLCAAAAVLIACATLAEHFLGRDFRIDELIAKEASGTGAPGRMDPASAAALAALGGALALVDDRRHAGKAQVLALIVGAASVFVLAGYVYAVPALYSFGPAPYTAVALLLLSAGAVCAPSGALTLPGRSDAAASFLSRVAPGAVAIPLVLGGLALLGYRRGVFETETGIALAAVLAAALVFLLVLWSAAYLPQSPSRLRETVRPERELRHIRIAREGAVAVAGAATPAAARDILLERTRLMFPGASAVTLRLLNHGSGELASAAVWVRSGAAPDIDETQALGERGRKPVETGGAVIVRNLQSDGQVHNEIFRQQRWVSYLGVPLLARGEAQGVLGVYTPDEYDFSREEAEWLAALAATAAGVLPPPPSEEAEAEPLTALSPHTTEQVKKALRLLPEMHAALAPLNPAASLSDAINSVIAKVLDATGADALIIRVWKKETGASVIAGHRGVSDEHVSQMEIGLLKGAMEWVVQHGQEIVAPNVEAEPRFATNVQRQLGFRSSALLPLSLYNEVRGILYLASRTAGWFDEAEKDPLVAVAQQIGISIENRELFDHLKNSRDEIEQASKIKGEFLSVMSHELRTPLSVVMGYAGMIKEKLLGDISPQQDDALQKLLTRANDQLNMINAIMQITQLESRALVLERHLVNLSEMLAHLKNDYALSHPKSEVTLNWNCPVEPIVIVTDGGKLKEILVNLINNALKFTPQGSVTVSMRVHEDARRKWVQLSVADTGVGIPKDQYAKIFEKFYQVDSSETRLYGGVGLGLYIVKHFAEFLGGKVDVASQPGFGSTFTVTIPYAT